LAAVAHGEDALQPDPDSLNPAGGPATPSVPSPPGPSAAAEPDLPESLSYRLKRSLLGPPLVSEELSGQRLGKPTALAVLSSDVMSSSAYATEQILYILVPIVGLAAFKLVTPITLVILAVLGFVTLCYRDVVRNYPKAGGSYVVSRENFGPGVAQIAGAALLISYTITVSVSVSAGTAAIVSAVPSLRWATVPLSVFFVLLLAYGNLRGIREAGKAFAVPTYFFIANMAVLIVFGVGRWAAGSLSAHPIHQAGALPAGHQGSGLLLGASLFYVLRAFANGGSAMTGTEAISNGVSIFRDPQPENARTTLVMMSMILGAMFLGVSLLAGATHAVPFADGTPTVVSQIGRFVYGTGPGGSFGYGCLQAATALILILAANTSFTGFPFLVSFVAEDAFLPRQLTRRGHRLVFSNGIILLTVAAIALVLATGAKVASLIPMYAIGVFTGFTMAGFGMVRHHSRSREPGWQRGVFVNAVAGVVCLLVDLIFAITEFTRGAWVVVVLMPVLVYGLIRLNRRYREEAAVLQEGAVIAAEAPALRRHVVLVMVDSLDMAAARAIQYARALNPDELRAIHFVVDTADAQALARQWTRLGLERLPLELVNCPDRRIARAALKLAAESAADGQTEVSMLMPRRSYRGVWGRLLHDQTADRIVDAVGQLPHVNATIVPFHLTGPVADWIHRQVPSRAAARARPTPSPAAPRTRAFVHPGAAAIAEVRPRTRAAVAGTIETVRVQPFGGVPSLECTIDDGSARLIIAFLGRRQVPGIQVGTRISAEGMVGTHRGQLALLNPLYEILAVPETA
jgi:amino acid transporter